MCQLFVDEKFEKMKELINISHLSSHRTHQNNAPLRIRLYDDNINWFAFTGQLVSSVHIQRFVIGQ